MLDKWVNELYQAYENRTTVSSLKFPDTMDAFRAYEIQDRVLQRKQETDELIGYKISLTSKETQDMFMSSTPLYGAMCSKTVVQDELFRQDLNEPLLELELVFLVQEELKLTDSVEDIMRKCHIAPGIEIPDSRFTNWFPNLNISEIIADSAVSGRIVYGEGRQMRYEDIDDIEGRLYFNDKLIAAGRSTEVLEHPANGVKWLIKEIAAFNRTLKPGMFVASGTFILPKAMEEGDYRADYDGVGEVRLKVR